MTPDFRVKIVDEEGFCRLSAEFTAACSGQKSQRWLCHGAW
jgi:hypothetical protein